jgi:hypothetical protein
MTTKNVQFRTLPTFGASERDVSEVVRGIMDGKTHNSGYFTTTTTATQTTLNDPRIGFDSAIIFTPMNDKAAQEMAKLWVGTRSQGSAVINHASNAHVCDFMYIVVG